MDLAIIWFFIWGFFWAGYFMLDGFDFGTGMIHNFIAKTEEEKKTSLHAIGPIWNGNEVWILGAGSSTWAAFPIVYATLISSLYLPVFLIIVGYILRGLALEYRNKIDSDQWRSFWDKSTFVGNFLLALLFGVAFGNIFQGLAIGPNGFEGTFFGLLGPYALLTGALFVTLFLLHGSLWMGLKVDGIVGERAVALSKKIWPITFITAAVFLVATYFATDLFLNFFKAPLLLIVPIIAVGALILIPLLSKQQNTTVNADNGEANKGESEGGIESRNNIVKAFTASCISIVSVTFTGIVGLFPALIPSSINQKYDLTILNSAGSDYSLLVVTIFALFFIPALIIYQIWIYRLFKGMITSEDVAADEGAY